MAKINNLIFTLFITFSTFNVYKYPMIHTLGKYGKTIIVPYVLLYILYKLYKGELKKIDSLTLSIFAFFIIGSVNYIMNSFNYEGLIYSLIFIIYIIYFYYFIYEFKAQHGEDFINELFKKLKNLFLFNMIVGFVIALGVHQPLWVTNKDGLAFGGFIGVSLLFGWFSLSFFFIVYFLKQKKILDYIILGVTFIFIYLSDGRGSQMVLVSFFLFHIYFKLKFMYLKYYLYLFLKSILFIFVLLTIYYGIVGLSYGKINEISTGRLFIWNLAVLNIFYDNIFYLGYGINSYPDYLLNKYAHISYYFKDLRHEGGKLSLHSSYLTIITTGGILSLVSFLLLVKKVLYKNEAYQYSAFILSLLVGGFVEQFIMSPNIPISTLFWLLVISLLIQKKEIYG